MSYFVGLDVSLRSVALCVVDADGDIVMERALDCEVEAIDGYLREFDKPITKLGFEAGVMSQMLFHGLQALGYDVVCMEARQVSAALSAMRNKTDKNDARGIAQVVRSGWYQPVHMKSRESHYIRAMLSSEMDNPGRISRAGDTEMRAALYTAANSLLTRTKQMSPLKSWGLRLVKRHGRKRGTVTVARKLAVILHRMWIDGTPYRWSDAEVAK